MIANPIRDVRLVQPACQPTVREIFVSLQMTSRHAYMSLPEKANGPGGDGAVPASYREGRHADEADSEVKLQCQLKDSWITSADDASKRS